MILIHQFHIKALHNPVWHPIQINTTVSVIWHLVPRDSTKAVQTVNDSEKPFKKYALIPLPLQFVQIIDKLHGFVFLLFYRHALHRAGLWFFITSSHRINTARNNATTVTTTRWAELRFWRFPAGSSSVKTVSSLALTFSTAGRDQSLAKALINNSPTPPSIASTLLYRNLLIHSSIQLHVLHTSDHVEPEAPQHCRTQCISQNGQLEWQQRAKNAQPHQISFSRYL